MAYIGYSRFLEGNIPIRHFKTNYNDVSQSPAFKGLKEQIQQ